MESGLIYNRIRFLNATLGRFQQRDPDDTAGLSLFEYEASNPIVSVDLLGQRPTIIPPWRPPRGPATGPSPGAGTGPQTAPPTGPAAWPFFPIIENVTMDIPDLGTLLALATGNKTSFESNHCASLTVLGFGGASVSLKTGGLGGGILGGAIGSLPGVNLNSSAPQTGLAGLANQKLPGSRITLTCPKGKCCTNVTQYSGVYPVDITAHVTVGLKLPGPIPIGVTGTIDASIQGWARVMATIGDCK